MIRLLSWNMAGRDCWQHLEGHGADIALLQEVRRPRSGVARQVLPSDDDPWVTAGWPPRGWRTAVARLSDEVTLDPRPTVAPEHATSQAEWSASRHGTIAAADVRVGGEIVFTAVSVYAPWEYVAGSSSIYADGSAHRILSDLSALMCSPRHRLLIAGDWNILFGYGEHGNQYFRERYRTVFDRAEALGLRYMGPQHPDGRQAEPWPEELPSESACVPTFHHNQQTPQTASRQLDFVFASSTFADRVRTRALNDPAEWGPSDHCRVVIDVQI